MSHYITLKHDPDILHDKEVNFRLLTFKGEHPEEVIAEGNGILIVDGPYENGLYELTIDITVTPDHPAGVGTWNTFDIPLSQSLADSIKVLKDGKLSCVDPST